MVQQYFCDPRLLRQFNKLIAQPIPPNQPNQPDPSYFNYACCFYGNLYIGKVKSSFGPKFQFKISSGNSSIGWNFHLSLDQANKGKRNEVGGFSSLSKQKLKETLAVKTDLSRSSLERTFTFQTNTFDKVNAGIRVKNKCSKDVFLFAPSNLVTKSRQQHVFCHFKLYEIKLILESINKKQIESKLPSTETRAERHETQRVYVQQIEPAPVCVIRKLSTVGKWSILGFLACPFFDLCA